MVTYNCNDGGVFDGNGILSVLCPDGVYSSSVTTCSRPTLPFVAAASDAITPSSPAGAVLTWETVPRSTIFSRSAVRQ